MGDELASRFGPEVAAKAIAREVVDQHGAVLDPATVLPPGELLTPSRIGALAANGTYTANVTVPLVGALPDSYRLIVVADARGFVADTDRENNTLASTGTFAIDILFRGGN